MTCGSPPHTHYLLPATARTVARHRALPPRVCILAPIYLRHPTRLCCACLSVGCHPFIHWEAEGEEEEGRIGMEGGSWQGGQRRRRKNYLTPRSMASYPLPANIHHCTCALPHTPPLFCWAFAPPTAALPRTTAHCPMFSICDGAGCAARFSSYMPFCTCLQSRCYHPYLLHPFAMLRHRAYSRAIHRLP